MFHHVCLYPLTPTPGVHCIDKTAPKWEGAETNPFFPNAGQPRSAQRTHRRLSIGLARTERGGPVLSQKSSLLFKLFILVFSIGCGSDGGAGPPSPIPKDDCGKINQCSPHVGFGPAPCTCDPAVERGICPKNDCTTECKPQKTALVYSQDTYTNPVWGKTHMSIDSCDLPTKCLDALEVYLEYGAAIPVSHCAVKYPVTKITKKSAPDDCFEQLVNCGGGGHVEVTANHSTPPNGHYTYGTLPY
jgi:hypothetical protein